MNFKKLFSKYRFLYLLALGYYLSRLTIPPLLAQTQGTTVTFTGEVTPTVLEEQRPTLTSTLVGQTDRRFSQEFMDYLAVIPKNNLTPLDLPPLLTEINRETGTQSAIIYVYLQPMGRDVLQEATQAGPLDSLSGGVLPPNRNPQASDQLVLIVATADGLFTPISVPNVTRRDLLALQQQFQRNLTNISPSEVFLPQATTFYDWLIRPLQELLNKQKINHLSFIVDTGLRSLPLAALYDAKTGKYLVQQFSVGMMPSLSLTNITRNPSKNTKVLAMGADTFTQQKPLPAVPLELQEIGKNLWPGSIYLNQAFTVANFRQAISSREYGFVHLATHGEFQSGDRNNSFVVFSDQNLKLDQFANSGLDQPIDLLTLSACRTALGDPQAELGFAGVAVKTGVRTAIGSLWQVSDEGTFALMTNFYESLKRSPIKAMALQQAQKAFIEKTVKLKDNQLQLGQRALSVQQFPPDLREALGKKDLTHPYYWSAFTLIGNPW